VQVLKDERDRVEKQLSALNAALTAFVGVYGGKILAISAAKPKHHVSAAARLIVQSREEITLLEIT
jgi:hypothetical protein